MHLYVTSIALAFAAGAGLAQDWVSPAVDSNWILLDSSKYIMATIKGPARSRSFGQSIVPLGDITGAGYPAFAVGYEWGSDTNNLNYGRTQVFVGGNPFDPTPVQTITQGSIRCAGDLDGDRQVDAVTWSSKEIIDSNYVHVVRIMYGSAAGFDTLRPTTMLGYERGFGRYAAIADCDGDGRNELIMLTYWDLFIYKIDSASRTASLWFHWALTDSRREGAALRVVDADNDGVQDIEVSVHLTESCGTCPSPFHTYVLWGRLGATPDTTNMLQFNTLYGSGGYGNGPKEFAIDFMPVFVSGRNDLVYLRKGRYWVFRWRGKRWSTEMIDTSAADFALIEPGILDPTHLPYGSGSLYSIGPVNGTDEPCLAATISYYDAFYDEYWSGAAIYSGGRALDSRIDAALDLRLIGLPDGSAIIGVQDLDGGGIPEAAIPDAEYGSPIWAGGSYPAVPGTVYIIRGSTDYPHKPIRLSVPDAVMPRRASLWAAPNPFRSMTSVSFRTESGEGMAELTVVDALGREVYRGRGTDLVTGAYEFRISAASWPAGSYYVRLSTRRRTAAIRIIHL